MHLRTYIFYSTIFVLFSEALQIHLGIDLRLSYFIILSNLVLIITMYPRLVSIKINHLLVLGYLAVSGVFSILRGTNSAGLFLEQLGGITISSIYFYLFFKLFADKSIADIFIAYCKTAYIVILIGFARMFVELFINVNFWRFQSIFTEPSHCITVIFPALFYYFKTGSKLKAFTCFLALVLTFSSVGYLGLVVAILINSRINFKYIFLSLVASILFFIVAYKSSDYFSTRVNDTVVAITKADISKANLSSYALVSNMFVAFKSFQSNPLLGSGLGSHQYSHNKYIGKLTGIENFDEFININSSDANSLMLRVISDLGLIGVLLVIYFIAKNYNRRSNTQNIITKSVFLYFFCKLLREGHYFSPEMYFFVFLYYFNARNKPATPPSRVKQQAAVISRLVINVSASCFLLNCFVQQQAGATCPAGKFYSSMPACWQSIFN